MHTRPSDRSARPVEVPEPKRNGLELLQAAYARLQALEPQTALVRELDAYLSVASPETHGARR